MLLTDNSELDRHVESKDVEDDLEWGPFLCAEEPPCPWRQDEGVPCSDGERTDEEVLVSREMRREVERRGEDVCWVDGHGGLDVCGREERRRKKERKKGTRA